MVLMDIIIIGLLVLNVVAVAAVLFRRKTNNSLDSTLLLKQDMASMSEQLTRLREGISDQLNTRLDKSHEHMSRQMSASSQLIKDVTERLAKIDETNRRVVDVAEELKTLQNVLQNPKQRGVLGEYYLENVLKNVLPPERYQLQYKFADGEIVDAVIFLDKNRILPIDSKFSLENYNRLVEEKDKDKREKIAALFKSDLKHRIDETSKYIRSGEGTMDFAFMFIPSEAIYYDLLVNKVGLSNTSSRDLIEYAFRDKQVIIVSPTSFMAYLQTVMQGLRSLQIEEQAKEIQKRVGQLGQHIRAHEEGMRKLGASLGTTVGHYNRAHKELAKMDKDVVRIASTDPSVEPLLLDKPLNDSDEI
jgi:DNA recombination protein RmuC